jgi:hypothetical protein
MEGTLFGRLHVAGYDLRTDGETLRVSPSAGLTAELRREIAGHKAELIACTLWWGIWRELEASRERLPERPEGERWEVLLTAYERLSLALPPEVVEQLELLGSAA